MFAAAMASGHHPVLVQIVPTRRCNLACAYCNEYDRHSSPVPTAEMLARIDHLGRLGASIIMLSGGEPLLHPAAAEIIGRIRRVGALAGLITNGYLLTPARIGALNRAGLDYLQLSIDNLRPDEVSRKSLETLDRRLRWLAARALFAVTVNTALAPALPRPEDAVTIARRARQRGFNSTIGIQPGAGGGTIPLPPRHLSVYEEVRRYETAVFAFSHLDRFQRSLAHGLVHEWHCGAGGRYLYVCENGLVHYCSQQRGRPGIPLERYGQADLAREYRAEKPCAPRCSLSCVHQVAFLDEIREKPRQMLEEMIERRQEQDPGFKPPALLRVAKWAFLDSAPARLLGRLAGRLLVRPPGPPGATDASSGAGQASEPPRAEALN